METRCRRTKTYTEPEADGPWKCRRGNERGQRQSREGLIEFWATNVGRDFLRQGNEAADLGRSKSVVRQQADPFVIVGTYDVKSWSESA